MGVLPGVPHARQHRGTVVEFVFLCLPLLLNCNPLKNEVSVMTCLCQLSTHMKANTC